MSNLIYMHFMLGPFMLVLAYLFYRFPPRTINHLYGYRTPRSMRSEEAWHCANIYSARVMMAVSLLTCLAQVIFFALLDAKKSILWSAIFLVATLVSVIPLTEIHLKKKGFR